MMKWIVVNDMNEMARIAADQIAAQVLLNETSVLGLATGSTPLGVYERLIAWHRERALSFRGVRTVNLDEYCGLAGDHPQSYRYYMEQNLFQHIDIEKNNTHLPNGMATGGMEKECLRYDALIDALGGIDLQLLGIGHNGHIGFNEPDEVFTASTHCTDLSLRTREANAIHFPGGFSQTPHSAITMGMRAIMQARRVLLIAGSDKKEIVARACTGPVTPEVPASILQLHPCVTIVSCE